MYREKDTFAQIRSRAIYSTLQYTHKNNTTLYFSFLSSNHPVRQQQIQQHYYLLSIWDSSRPHGQDRTTRTVVCCHRSGYLQNNWSSAAFSVVLFDHPVTVLHPSLQVTAKSLLCLQPIILSQQWWSAKKCCNLLKRIDKF